MRASTLFLATFTIWIVAKGRGGKYWALATTNAVGGVPSSAPASVTATAPVNPLDGAVAGLMTMGTNLLNYYNGAK